MRADGYKDHDIANVFKYGAVIAGNIDASAIRKHFIH